MVMGGGMDFEVGESFRVDDQGRHELDESDGS
jgi:hypothetical protein